MLKRFIRITLSIMILYISTFSQVEACCCEQDVPSQYAHCDDTSADHTQTLQILKCQCDQQTSKPLLRPNKPAVVLSTKHFSLIPTTDQTFNSQIYNTIYRPPIFI